MHLCKSGNLRKSFNRQKLHGFEVLVINPDVPRAGKQDWQKTDKTGEPDRQAGSCFIKLRKMLVAPRKGRLQPGSGAEY